MRPICHIHREQPEGLRLRSGEAVRTDVNGPSTHFYMGASTRDGEERAVKMHVLSAISIGISLNGLPSRC